MERLLLKYFLHDYSATSYYCPISYAPDLEGGSRGVILKKNKQTKRTPSKKGFFNGKNMEPDEEPDLKNKAATWEIAEVKDGDKTVLVIFPNVEEETENTEK